MKTQNNKQTAERQSLFEDDSPLTSRQEAVLVLICGFAVLGMLCLFIGVVVGVYFALGQ